MADNTIILFPTRMKCSGTVTLAAGATDTFAGEDGKQKRRQFIVTNLDANLLLKIVDRAGRIGQSVFPSTSVTVETTDDLGLYNPDGASTVDYEVLELFYDPGVVPMNLKSYGALGSGVNNGGYMSPSQGDTVPGGRHLA